jgi:hypothetical protein
VHIGICAKGCNVLDESKDKQDGVIIFCRDLWGCNKRIIKTFLQKTSIECIGGRTSIPVDVKVLSSAYRYLEKSEKREGFVRTCITGLRWLSLFAAIEQIP